MDVAGHYTSVAFYMPPQKIQRAAAEKPACGQLPTEMKAAGEPPDYLVLFQHWRVRFPDGPAACYAKDHVPINTIRIAGVDLVWIYRMDQHSP